MTKNINSTHLAGQQFADVVPLVYLPRGIGQEFTYSISPNLETSINSGQIVVIPFRKKNVRGVVVAKYKERKVTLKKILEIESILPCSPLTRGQLSTVHELENYYGASRTLAYKTVVPWLSPKSLVKNQQHAEKSPTIAPLTPLNRRTLQLLLKSKDKMTITGALYDPRHHLFIEYIRRRIKKEGQILLLFPDNESAEIAKESYKKYFNESTLVIWSSHAPIGQLTGDWGRISTGEARVVLATRSGPFLPFKSLRAIVLFDEADNNYKSWDQQPYYDTRYLVERLAAFEHVPLLTTRIMPPSSSKNRILGKIGTTTKAKLIILDRRDCREKNREEIIPEIALKAIGQSSVSAQSLVFINRLGYAAILCNDCQYAFRCSNCDSHLIYFLTVERLGAAILKCLRCGQIENSQDSCPRCHGLRLRYFGLGIERILEELRHKFPNKKIQRMDRDSLKKKDNLYALLNNIRFNHAEITVATSIILPRLWALPSFNTVIIMQAESLFLSPNWHAHEDGLVAIHQLWAAAKQYCYIETNLPEHPVIRGIQSGKEAEFIKHEFRERERFRYPPYARLIKLTASNNQATLPWSIEHDNNLSIVNLGLQKNRRCFLIKAPPGYKLDQLWPQFSNWKIDVDPVSII